MEHVGGHGEASGVAVEDGVMDDVLREHGFADAVGSEEHDVDGIVDEGEREELVDELAVDGLGPLPIEVGGGFEGADARIGESPFERASFAFTVFDVDDGFEPGLAEERVVLGGETVQAEGAQSLAQGV